MVHGQPKSRRVHQAARVEERQEEENWWNDITPSNEQEVSAIGNPAYNYGQDTTQRNPLFNQQNKQQQVHQHHHSGPEMTMDRVVPTRVQAPDLKDPNSFDPKVRCSACGGNSRVHCPPYWRNCIHFKDLKTLPKQCLTCKFFHPKPPGQTKCTNPNLANIIEERNKNVHKTGQVAMVVRAGPEYGDECVQVVYNRDIMGGEPQDDDEP